jgi:hypothetical protein
MRVVPPLTGRLDMALSNFIKGYRQAELVGDYLFPRLPVMRQTDRYWIFGRENQQISEQDLRAAGAPAAETRFSLSTAQYAVQSHALKSTIADEDRDMYTVGDLTMDSVSVMQDKILLAREIRIATLSTTAANYAAANTLALAGTAKWSDYVNSDPQGDIERAKRQIRLTGQSANTLVLADDTFTTLRNHPKLKVAFQYNQVTGPLNTQQLATVLGVDKVIVASAVQHDGVNPSFVWSNVALLVYVSPTVGAAGVLSGLGTEGSIGPKQLSFGKSFTWTGAPGTVDGYGVVIARHPDVTAKSDIVGVDWYSTEVITGSDCGFLYTGCVS